MVVGAKKYVFISITFAFASCQKNKECDCDYITYEKNPIAGYDHWTEIDRTAHDSSCEDEISFTSESIIDGEKWEKLEVIECK